MPQTQAILSSMAGNPYGGLQRADALWHDYRHGKIPIPQVVTTQSEDLGIDAVDTVYDVVICGGTLGILLAASLVKLGWKVAVLERGVLKGRAQEWNISRNELRTFVDLGLLTEAELESAIATEYNPARICFGGGMSCG